MRLYDHDSLYHVFLQVMRVHYNRTHELLDKIGVYPGQPQMLITLYHKDGQSQKELSNWLKIKASTINVMIRRMEKAGLVEKQLDSEDQRVSRIYLTPKGKELCKKVIDVMKVIESECFKDFTMEEQVLLRRLLIEMRDNLSESFDKK